MGHGEARRQQRERGRRERQRLWPKTLHVADLPDVLDPPAYLEEQRGRYIRMLETIAEETDGPVLRARILLDLLKLSSLGRSRVDDTTQPRLQELPDLSHLGVDVLERLLTASPEALAALVQQALPLAGDGTPA
jgi:hypothetical protein